MYGLKNDTVSINVLVQLKEEFGDLTLKITQLDSTKNYVCQVYGGGGVVEKELYIEQKSSFTTRIETLQPDGYTIKIIEDLNKNRRWDTGNYDKYTQPERIFMKTAESLRANWEVEVEIPVEFRE